VPHTITLILGGVRSGKSRFAQHLAERVGHVTVIATAQRRDDPEMHARIDRHRADRPTTWTTIEEPIQLARAIRESAEDTQIILIDCLTLFAANLLEACGDDPAQLESHIARLCTALRAAPCPILLVSNEVGSGVVPAYASGRRFRDLAGEINQRIAGLATVVVLMIAGLPLPLKGPLPLEIES
jgi:adenosylcobinamide kinase/adenosylcobinamide-phosphate guanylyltransferase